MQLQICNSTILRLELAQWSERNIVSQQIKMTFESESPFDCRNKHSSLLTHGARSMGEKANSCVQCLNGGMGSIFLLPIVSPKSISKPRLLKWRNLVQSWNLIRFHRMSPHLPPMVSPKSFSSHDCRTHAGLEAKLWYFQPVLQMAAETGNHAFYPSIGALGL